MDVPAARLAAQHVARPAHASAKAVVRWMGAVQAQDHAAALWAIGLRTRAPRVEAVRRAVERGDILRTWPMRGTIHFLAKEDARAMVALLAPRALRRAASRERELGLTPAVLAKARRSLTRALGRAGVVTRADAYATLERAGVPTRGQRGVHIVGHLAQEGTLCIGPHEGKEPTVALLAERAPAPRGLTLAEVAERYVRSHGPASAVDFAWWTGAPLTAAREALAGARGIREREGMWSATRPRAARESSPAAHLLPAFDEYAVAYKDRSAALRRVAGRANASIGLLSPSIVVDGQMVGSWGRALEKDRVRVALKPLAPWTSAEREAIEEAAERYARFLGMELALRPRP